MALLIGAVGYCSMFIAQQALENAIGQSTATLAADILDNIDINICHHVEELQAQSTDTDIHNALALSNARFAKLDNVQEFINEREWASHPESTTTIIQELTDNRPADELRRLMAFYNAKNNNVVLGEIFATNKYGANVAQTGRTSDYYQADEQWWQLAVKNGIYVGDVTYDESAKVYSTDIAVAINDDGGELLGAIKAVFNIEDTIKLMTEAKAASEYGTMQLKLVNNSGQVIYSTEPFELLEDASNELVPKFGRHQTSEHTHYFIGTHSDQTKKLFVHAHSRGYRDFAGLGWILIAKLDTNEIFAPITRLGNAIFIVSLAAVTLAALAAWATKRSICVPLAKLSHATAQIGRGNLDTKVQVAGKDEIGQLAESFEKMTTDLKKTVDTLNREIAQKRKAEEKLRDSNQFLDDVFDGIRDGISVLDTDLNIVKVNRWIEEIYSHQMPLVGKKCFVAYQQRQSPCPWCPSARVLKTKKPQTEIVPYPSAETPNRWIELSSYPLTDEKGNVTGIIEHVKDITARKKAEETLEKVNKDLEKTIEELSSSNNQLEEFVHIAAHDLKTPLRGIGTLADWIATDYADKFDDKGRDKVRLLVTRVKRIDELINAMLRYSRIKRTQQYDEPVDINLLLSELIRECDIPEEFAIEIQTNLPMLVAQRQHIKQLLKNLITNAVEFTDKPQGRISIDCAEDNGLWKFNIADNGPGIEPQHHERIFKIFQTLSDTDEYQATGIGLTEARKIVELYSGRIWVESEPGQGSTFFFTLPKNKNKEESKDAPVKAHSAC